MAGSGGMGAVYKARQISLDRLVAIKILPPEAAGEEDLQFVERFKNEARTMAKMNHPAIVHVYDFGETSDGQLYIAMEYIDGTDVAKMILSQGKLPPDHALAITAHVCDALQYAHTHGVIHRDIKPANILINMDGAVKVADFGLAKASEAEQGGLTKTNMAMGTPDFVAPEALIAGIPLDGRADLYAVGVMLYQMLTGNIPRGLWTMPSVMLKTDPRFDSIITKAMQTDREHRYQSAQAMRRDLDVILTVPIATEERKQTIPPGNADHRSAPVGPQGRAPGNAAVPAAKPVARRSAPAAKPKSSLGPIIGIAATAIIGVVLFFVFNGGRPTEDTSTASSQPMNGAVGDSVQPRQEPEPSVSAAAVAQSTTPPIATVPSAPPPGIAKQTTDSLALSNPAKDTMKAEGDAKVLREPPMTSTPVSPARPAMDLIAMIDPALDSSTGKGTNSTTIRKEGSRLRIYGDKFSGTVRAPVAILGSEYELEIGVGKEWGTAVILMVPLQGNFVNVVFNSSGVVGVTSGSKPAEIIPRGNGWPAAQPVALKLRVKLGADGQADELEARIADRPGVIWHGRLADCLPKSGSIPEPQPGLTISPNVKEIESFTLRMIQGEARPLRASPVSAVGAVPAVSSGVSARPAVPASLREKLQRGISGHWALDGDGKSARGSLNGTPQMCEVVPGVVGKALDFSKPESAVVFSKRALNDDFKELTVLAWVNPRTHGEAAYDGYGRTVISRTEDGGFALRVRRGVIQADLRTESGNAKPEFGPAVIPVGEWSMLALTYDGSQTSAFVNGQPQGQPVPHRGRIKKTERDSALLMIGNEPGTDPASPKSAIQPGGFGWDGAIDEVTVYSRVLSGEEIHAAYLLSKPEPLVASKRRSFDVPPSSVPSPGDPRIAQLETGFKSRYAADAQKPFDDAVATLNANYIRALGIARSAAQSKGVLAEVTVLDDEAKRIQNHEGVPPADAGGTPDSLVKLRATYRGTIARHAATRDAAAAPLYDLYLKALDTYITELTRAGKIDEARRTQAFRDELAR